MTKKQAITPKTAPEAATKVTTGKTAAAPKAPRVSSAKHSKAAAAEIMAPVAAITEKPQENRHEAIAKIAYGYWISRGYQGGNPHEDWLRAEQEYLARQ